MRVVAGKVRGLSLKTLDGDSTRPTRDMVREALFNIIANKTNDAIFLDLFAGSGAIGIEALSRGAKKAYFVDVNKEAIGIVKQNVEKAKFCDNSVIIQNDFSKALDTFKNEKFDGEKKIAPNSKGTYQFYIKNISKSDVKYDIKFTDEMNHFVNMKYKLKMDNIYIKGNADNYVTLDELNLDDIMVLKDSLNIFTLEWYWEDDDELDTYIGGKSEEDRYYKLNLEINSKEYKK